MIGFLVDRLVDLVVKPQADLPASDELRVKYTTEPGGSPTDMQQVNLLAGTTRPTGRDEIGGTVGLRHTVSIELYVQHGDPKRATHLRDSILTALVLRLHDTARDELLGSTSPDGRQEIEAVAWDVDYFLAEAALDSNRRAAVTITVDTSLRG